MKTLRDEFYQNYYLTIEKGRKYYYVRSTGNTNLQNYDVKNRISKNYAKKLLELSKDEMAESIFNNVY